jgi:hypothetical protein
MASLRDPKQAGPGQPALHRLLARYIAQDRLRGDGMSRWALLIHLLALAAPDHHRGGDRLGRALFAAGDSEGRLTRLLETPAVEREIVPRLAGATPEVIEVVRIALAKKLFGDKNVEIKNRQALLLGRPEIDYLTLLAQKAVSAGVVKEAEAAIEAAIGRGEGKKNLAAMREVAGQQPRRRARVCPVWPHGHVRP